MTPIRENLTTTMAFQSNINELNELDKVIKLDEVDKQTVHDLPLGLLPTTSPLGPCLMTRGALKWAPIIRIATAILSRG